EAGWRHGDRPAALAQRGADQGAGHGLTGRRPDARAGGRSASASAGAVGALQGQESTRLLPLRTILYKRRQASQFLVEVLTGAADACRQFRICRARGAKRSVHSAHRGTPPDQRRREMSDFKLGHGRLPHFTRRQVLRAGTGMAGAALIPGLAGVRWAHAQGKSPIGTWPAGTEGDTVYIGGAVPLTGTYAVQGEDERKGMQLAIEHINSNHELMKILAPKVDK